MNKFEMNKTRLCVQYDDHPKLMCTVLCSLLEDQSLVDLAIRCGNHTMHAHKCILAASSPFFREQLELNLDAEEVIINGIDFSTMKSVMEFIYCGETCVLEENLKYVVAAARLFQIRGLQALSSETNCVAGNCSGNGGSGGAGDGSSDELYIPPPIFMNKKPKYAYQWHQPQNAAEVLVDETRNGSTTQNPGVTADHHSIMEGTTYTSDFDALPLQMANIENVVIDSIIPLDFHGGTDNHEVLSTIPLDAIDFYVVGNGNETGMAENNAITNRPIRQEGQEQQLPLPTGEKCQNDEGMFSPDNSSYTIGIGKHHQHHVGLVDKTGYQLDVVDDRKI